MGFDDGIVCAAGGETSPTPQTADAARWAAVLLAALCLLVLLTACGGGGDDPPDVPTPAVDCNAHPEVCK